MILERILNVLDSRAEGREYDMSFMVTRTIKRKGYSFGRILGSVCNNVANLVTASERVLTPSNGGWPRGR